MFQENPAVGAFPLRIAGREMPPDIPQRQRTVKRIGQGVHPDIGVRMAAEAVRVRDAPPAQDHVIAGAESMYVKAVAGADIHRLSVHHARRAVEILRMRQFQVLLFALDHGHVKPGGQRHGDIVGGPAGMGGMGGADAGQVKPLWRLRAKQPVARLQPGDQAVLGPPQRIGRGQRRGRAGMIVQRVQNPVDQRGADQWSGAVMDQHAVAPVGNRGQPRPDRSVTAVGTMGDKGIGAQPGAGLIEQGVSLGIDHNHDRADPGVRQKGIGRTPHYAFSQKVLELLGNHASGPDAATGGDDDCGCCHGPRSVCSRCTNCWSAGQ